MGARALQHEIRVERWVLPFRFLVMAAAASGLGYYYETQWDIAPAIAIGAALYALYVTILVLLILPRLTQRSLVYAMALVDAGAIGAVLYMTMGTNTPFIALMPLVVTYYALMYGLGPGLGVAAVLTTALIIVHVRLDMDTPTDQAIATYIPVLFVLALVGGYFRLRGRKREALLSRDMETPTATSEETLEAVRHLTGNLDVDEVSLDAVGVATRLVGGTGCVMMLLDSEGQSLIAQAGNGDMASLELAHWRDLRIPRSSDPETELALESRQVRRLPNETHAIPSWAATLGARCLMLVPLAVGQKVVGIAYHFDVGEGCRFTPAQERTARSFWAVAGGMVYAAYQVAVMRQSAERVTGVTAVGMPVAPPVGTSVSPGGPQSQPGELTVGNVRIDRPRGRVLIHNQAVSLSPTEVELLYLLAQYAGTPVAHATIRRQVWGEAYQGQGNVVDVTVHRLRRKLEQQGYPGYIRTIRGKGYLLSATHS